MFTILLTLAYNVCSEDAESQKSTDLADGFVAAATPTATMKRVLVVCWCVRVVQRTSARRGAT